MSDRKKSSLLKNEGAKVIAGPNQTDYLDWPFGLQKRSFFELLPEHDCGIFARTNHQWNWELNLESLEMAAIDRLFLYCQHHGSNLTRPSRPPVRVCSPVSINVTFHGSEPSR